MIRRPPRSTLLPYTTLSRSRAPAAAGRVGRGVSQAAPPRCVRLSRARRGGMGEMGDGKRGGSTHRARRRGELAAGGAGGRWGARRDGALGRRDRGRGRRRVSARQAPGQHRFRSVVAQADDARVRDAGAGRAAPAPLARADLYVGVPMEELSPLEPSLAPTHNLVAERLFRARIVILTGEITQRVAANVTAQLLAMAGESSDDITVFINSQGGHVEAGDTIHDLVRFLSPRVRMVGTGWVASIAALIYVAVPREDRYCLPNTRFLLHQPAGGTGGTASDIEIEAREILKMRDRLNRAFAQQTGQPLERIEEDTRRNFWLSAEEARRYGLVGRVIEHQAELGAAQ